MARTIQEIIAQQNTELAAQSDLSTLNSTSQTAIYKLWMYIVAAAIYYFEVLQDIFKTELETIIDNAPVGTDGWVQSKSFEFQYSATVAQVVAVDLNTWVISYPIIDTSLQIITRCSVKTLPNKVVSVKVAKSDPPVALSGGELSSFQGYLDEISFAGVQYNSVSLTSDKLFLEASIYYDGQYSTVISSTVIAAINTYLANIPFDGDVRIVSLKDAIQAVPGVKDIVIDNLGLRADTTLFANKILLVQNKTTMFNKYPMAAGYAIEETTVGETFADKLTFIPE
jgi:hypothetical protein